MLGENIYKSFLGKKKILGMLQGFASLFCRAERLSSCPSADCCVAEDSSQAPSWRCSGQTAAVHRSPEWTNTRGTSAKAWIPAQRGHAASHHHLIWTPRHLKASATEAHLPSPLIRDWRTSNHVWSQLKMKGGEEWKEASLTFIKLRSISFLPGQHWLREEKLIFSVSPASWKSPKITAGCCAWPKPKRGACIIKHDENHVSCDGN